MSLIEVVMATVAVALTLGPILFYISHVYKRYAVAVAKKAIFPIADEVKLAVVRDLNSYFSLTKPAPPCTGNGAPIPLPTSLKYRSGIVLTPLTKTDASNFKSTGAAPRYAEAVRFCGGDRNAVVGYGAVTFKLPAATTPWDIFNPPPNDFSKFTSFDFCAKVTCAQTSSFTVNPICQFTQDPSVPMLALFHYVIRSTSNGSLIACEKTHNQLEDTWPADAIGELSYLFLGSTVADGAKTPRFVADSGVFYSNTGTGK